MERDDDHDTWKSLRGWRRKSDGLRRSDLPHGIKAGIDRSCTSKRRFRDVDEVKRFIRNLCSIFKDASRLRYYHCAVCLGYHTTKEKLGANEMTFHQELQELGGLWQYRDGGKYLALLASGKISDCFCNLGVLTTRPERLEFWAQALVREIRSWITSPPKELCVVGPGMGGITLAYEIAKHLHTGSGTQAFFTEPEYDFDGKKGQKFRFDFTPGAEVLMVEDVITTGGSVQKTFNAMYEKGGFSSVFQIVGCLVDRRADKGYLQLQMPKDWSAKPTDMKVVSLLSITPRTWDTLALAQKDCPSVVEAIKPKANWKQLVEG